MIKNEVDFDKLNYDIDSIYKTKKISKFYIEHLNNIYKMAIRYNFFIIREFGNTNFLSTKEIITDKKILELTKKYLILVKGDYINTINELYSNEQIIFTNDKNELSRSEYDYLKRKYIITINKENNYMDVLKLVHEFMHYTNFNIHNPSSEVRNDLTEFISIYHELNCSIKLLKRKTINPNNLNNIDRFFSSFDCSSDILNFFLPLMLFSNNKIDENSYKNININKKIKVKKEFFIDNCQNISNLVSRAKDNYDVVSEYINNTCNYLFSTFLAFYSLFDFSFNDIDIINNSLSKYRTKTSDLLLDMNIKIDDIFENKSLENMNTYFLKYIKQ